MRGDRELISSLCASTQWVLARCDRRRGEVQGEGERCGVERLAGCWPCAAPLGFTEQQIGLYATGTLIRIYCRGVGSGVDE